MARRIEVQLIGDDASLQRMFKRTEVGAAGVGGAIGKLTVGFGALAKSFLFIEVLDKALEGLGETVRLGTEEFKDNVTIQAQTQAALKATGNAAHTSAGKIDELGLKLSNLSGVDDEIIRIGENTLLAFTNIRNFAGKGNQIFDEATKAALDFSVRTGRGIQASAVAIGRALQDPAKAAGSLRRAYVVLTDDEKKAITSAVAHGDVLRAQRDILGDLEKRYGGAAEAAGKTLPGALNVLKDRFKDLAGNGIGKVSPELTKATRGLADFVVKLSQAGSFTGGFKVFVGGLADLNQKIAKAVPGAFHAVVGLDKTLFNAVKQEIESIDWSKLAASAEASAGQIAATIGDRLAAIDWRQKITIVARKLGGAIVDSLHGLNDAIRRVDWNKVGQEIAKGIGLAIGATVIFIKNLNLGKITHALADVLGAALLAVAGILEGIGQQIGQALLKGIEAGLNKAKNAVLKLADETVLKIIAPFKLLGHIGADPFVGLRKSLEASIQKMQGDAAAGGRAVGDNLGQEMVKAFLQKAAALKTPGAEILGPPIPTKTPTPTTAGQGPDKLPAPPSPTGLPQRPGITAAQRNTFFDNQISRILLRGGLGDIKQQLGAINEASALISKRLAATKDITRKLNLEDQLLQLADQARTLRQQLSSDFLDSLNLNLARAQTTNTLNDDLAALRKIQAALQSQIKEFGKTNDLETQLLDVREQIKQTVQKQRDAAQFFTLGLSPTGDVRVPLVKALQKQLANVSLAVAGTFLDTTKTQSVLGNIKKVLSAGIGGVSETVRAKLKELLDGINQQLKDHAQNLTKFSHVNSAAFVKALGLDLSPDLVRRLRLGISQLGAGNTAPGVASAAFALAGGTTVIHTSVQLDGREVAKSVTKHHQKAPPRLPSRRN
jgi:hypothetical protein